MPSFMSKAMKIWVPGVTTHPHELCDLGQAWSLKLAESHFSNEIRILIQIIFSIVSYIKHKMRKYDIILLPVLLLSRFGPSPETGLGSPDLGRAPLPHTDQLGGLCYLFWFSFGFLVYNPDFAGGL